MYVKFNDGDVVIITDSAIEYKQRYIGKTGTVESTFRTHDKVIMYGVRFENLRNPISSKGLFWFRAKSLDHHIEDISSPVIIESEEIPMFENYVVAKVQFLNDVPVYSYALYDSDVRVGDTVVVQTGHHGFALATVEAIDTDPNAKKEVKCGRQVVCKVDFSAYNARQDALRRAEELKRSMDAVLKETQAMAIYEMFAEKNPSLKAMLNEFKTLQSEIKGVVPTEEQK